MDETHIKFKGVWKYLYRAGDKDSKTVDFLLTAKRDASAAGCFFEKEVWYSDIRDKVTMSKSGAIQPALVQLNKERKIVIAVRQLKYLNNIVEPDYHAVKRVIRPMLGVKSIRST